MAAFICDDDYATAVPQGAGTAGQPPVLVPFPADVNTYARPGPLLRGALGLQLGGNEDFVPTAATPAIVQYYSWGCNTNRNGVTSKVYTLRLCNPVGAGNCLILIIDCQHSNTFNGVSDDVGNTWSNTPQLTVDGGAGSQKTSYLVLPNCVGGGRTITVNLGTADDNFHPTFVEVCNISSSPIGASVSSIATTAPSPSAGNITAGAGSFLIGYAIDNSALIGNAAQALTAITPTAGWTMLTGDICFAANPSMNFNALQYNTNATGSAQSTTMSLTGGTDACNYIVLELKSALAGTPMPTTGIYAFGFKCALNGDIAASPWKVFMPNVGTCLAVIEDDGSLRAAPTDTAGGTWVLDVTGSTAPVSGAAHAAGLAPSQSRIISFAVSSLPQNTNYCIWDVVRCSGVVQKVTFPSTVEGTSWTGTVAITPLKNNGLVVNFAGTGVGPILTQTGPTGSYYISVNYTGQTDTDDMDNANGISMTYYSSLAAQSYGYTIAAGTSINATALELGLLIPLPVEDEFDPLRIQRAIPPYDSLVTVW